MKLNHTIMQISSRYSTPSQRSRRASGFTLVEIVVVLAIGAIVSAVTVSGFKELSEGNRNTNCQANLAQVYQAIRLYSADEGSKFPLYYRPMGKDATGAETFEKHIGLWALWTFPRDPISSADAPAARNELAKVGEKPIDRYIRNVKVFHCPADEDNDRAELYTTAERTTYNMKYLSYQVNSKDGATPITGVDDTLVDRDDQTYLPSRTSEDTGATDGQQKLWRRQLDHINYPPGGGNARDYRKVRPPLESTVITWCRWHRYSRDRDNVLFFDGSVQSIPRVQDNYVDGDCTPAVTPAAPTLENWKRRPKFPACSY